MSNPFTAHPASVGETYSAAHALRVPIRHADADRRRRSGRPLGFPVPVRDDGEPHQRPARRDARAPRAGATVRLVDVETMQPLDYHI